jgi:hypothetical protein
MLDYSTGDAADDLQSGSANPWGCQPMLIGDLVNLSDARAAPLELTQKHVSHPRGNCFKGKRLIQVHVPSCKLNHVICYRGVQNRANPRRFSSGFLFPPSIAFEAPATIQN